MGVKKQMDTFFASLGEQTGYNGRLVNTPMGPFRWNDVMELWENVNNGMVLNNISFMDEFAMMDYTTIDGGKDATNALITAVLDLNFLTGSLDPRITFRRTSLGSYIGSDGTLKFSDVNLFWDTEQIGGSTWDRGADSSIVPGSTSYILGPSGVTNGYRHSVKPGVYYAVRTQTSTTTSPAIVSGITYTQSWYIKGDTGSQFRFFYVNGGTGNTVWVNLLKGSTTGTPQTYVSTATSANIDLSFDLLYSATAWTEIKAELRTTGFMGGSNIPLFYLTSISAPAGITKTIDVAEPMLYPFSGSKSYIASPQDGPYGGPRFEYSITGQTLGLLVEQQATNVAQSLVLPAGWGRSNVNFYPIAAESTYVELGPDNNISGAVMVSGSGSLSLIPSSSWPFGTSQTTNRSFSLWVKGWCGNTVAAIGFSGNAPFSSINDITTTLYGPGTVTKGLTAGNLLAYAQVNGLSTNAWSRITISATGGNVSPSEMYSIYPVGYGNYTDSPTRGIVVAYPQIESGLQPSSTIFAKYGAGTGVRSQDIVSLSGTSFSSWFSPNSDGTVIAQVISGTTGNFASNNYIWSINNSAATNTIRQVKGATSNNLLSSYVINGTGITIPTLTNVFTQGDIQRIALGWSIGTGGLLVDTNTTGATSANLIGATYPSGLNRMSIGVAETLSGSNFQGHIQRIQYFNQRLSNSDIENRTN